MKVVHYTKPFFKLHPITIKNCDGTCFRTKPLGGLWCSPLDSEYGWIDWCRDHDFEDIDHKQRVILDIDTCRLLVIDSAEDMEEKLSWYQLPPDVDIDTIDFEKLVQAGVDAIHLTIEGVGNTRFTMPHYLDWDCESVVILNERCIKNVEL